MSEHDRYQKISKMCREILESDEPVWLELEKLSKKDSALAIDHLLRAVMAFAEKEHRENKSNPLNYIEEKFYAGYNCITGQKVYPY
ncbi:hypothetical protein [Bacillus sp. Marseille-Q3570]|uniref:hypothetical protein n=1 Tax=Bacillus sp. Marseille-Q3570 TaxID=2963522 RepID=UPI0021B6E952|nr:hypothetical protein [Bacillus sp. Marseille-Q3570]